MIHLSTKKSCSNNTTGSLDYIERTKQIASSAATGIRGKRLGGLIFSKDRAMQLRTTLDSLFLHCGDSKEYDLFVLYRTSSKLHYEQYRQLKGMYPGVLFFEERDFKNQVLQVVKSYEYILFLVDDNIFVGPFSLSDIKSALATEKQALGFSLRLGANTNYCYSLSSPQKLPQFEEVNAHIIRYSWPGQQCDFGYPLEVSSSVYRCADILFLIEQSQFDNPNQLESAINKGKGSYKSMPYMLIFKRSVTFCNPVNVVQDTYNNKFGTVHSYTAEQLANDFSKGKIIDVKKYIGFTPNAVHQEVPIYYKSTYTNGLIEPINKICTDSHNKPKFSVIMANYNNGRYIADAIESVLNQTFSDWELIIIDDCSTDNSLEVIQRYLHDKRIKLIQHEVNRGYVSALKTGIEYVKSEFFGVLDSDDCLTKEAVEVMYDSHIRYLEFGLIYSQFMYCDENLASKRTGYCAEIPAGQTNLESNVVSHFKTFKLRDYLKTAGFDEGILYAEDKDIIYKMEEVTRLKFIDKCLYLYRELPSSQGHDPIKKQIGLLFMENAKLRALNRRNNSQISSSSQKPVDTGFNFLNKSATEYFLKALQEFEKGDFVSAYELMYKYRTTVDYRSLSRFINGEKAKEVDVSVVIVTYNRTEDVRKCIGSVDKQHTPREKYEVIVVDNGLTDENIIKPLCEQYIKCPVNLGLSEGRNIGACFAKGRIIAFLDDDALVNSNYISSIEEAFDKYDIFGFRGKVLPKTNPDVNSGADNYDRGNEPFCTFCDQEGNSAFLKDVYLDTDGMDPLLFGAEGSDLSYRIRQKYECFNRIIYWPETVIYHDATGGEAKKAKEERYKVNEKYLSLKLGISLSVMRREVEKLKLPVRCNEGNEASAIVQKLKKRHRFSFIMIVLNGIPFIEYSLKSIYDFAHEIIIIEGAVEDCKFAVNTDGSSTDGTVEFIKSFPDPARKIRFLQGKWPEKCEMQNEALKHVTGDYVWLIDSDEVYKKEDLEKIENIIKNDCSITQVNFLLYNFWKGLDYIFTSQKFDEPRNHCRRLFKYTPGAVFTTHRPPTMVWPGSDQTTEQMKLLDGVTTSGMGIRIYHYSYILDKQVKQKIELYRRYGWGEHWGVDLEQWYSECFQKWQPWNREQIDAKYPIWTGDRNSHTELFKGTHPEVMMDFVLKEANEPLTVRAMEHVIDVIEQLKNKFANENISAIETGTIRSFFEKHFSTYHISRSLGERGKLISVDISEDSLRVSKQICRRSTNVEFVQSDSIDYLSGLEKQKFHFALLDSVNDKDFIFNEFRLIVPMMVEGGIVIIDDAGISPVNHQIDVSVPAQKGHRIWEFIQSHGLEAELLTTLCNHGTQIKIKMTADNIHKINDGLFEVVNDVRKVLIVRSDSIGDLVIFGGSFKYYGQLYPNSHITLVVTDTVENLAEANPYVDEIITFNRTKMAFDRGYASQFIRQIQAGRYNVAICPAHSRDRISDFITINSGARELITTSGDTANQTAEQIENNNKYFTKILPATDGIELETFRNEEFLRNLGAKIDGEYTPIAWFTKEDIDFAGKLLEQINVQNPILISPFAQSPIRDWHIENWAELISSHKDVPIVICGLEKDQTGADKIMMLTGHPNAHNLCGKTSVRQLAALISMSRLCISPESATAHLAAAAGCPHVVLVGGGHFGRFMPYSKLTKMLYVRMDCFGCNWKCRYGKDIKCIKAISLKMVEQAIESSLAIDNKPVVTRSSEMMLGKEIYEYLVSAIVSTYNSEKFIHGCLEDLERQTIADRIEIIVVNSGSQQNEEAIVKEFQQKYNNIKYIKTQHRETIYQAWNRAVKTASGKYLTVANTDDRHRRDAMKIMTDVLESDPGIALVYADQYETSNENETFENVTVSKKNVYPDFEPGVFLDIGWCNIGSQPMWRAEIHREIGNFDGNFEIAGDYDFLMKVCEKYRCFHIPQTLGTFYRAKGKTVSCSNGFRLSEVENPLAKARSLVRKGIKFIDGGEYTKGIEYLRKSMQCWPNREAVEYIQITEEQTKHRRGSKANIEFEFLGSVWDWPKEMSSVGKVEPAVVKRFNDTNTGKYLLSVVITGCNCVEEIQSCLEQLAAQSIADKTEVLFVTGQLSKCREVSGKYRSRFANWECVELNQDQTVFSGVNCAVKSSAGRFVTILKPGYKYYCVSLEQMAGILDKDMQKAGVYTSAVKKESDFGTMMWRRCLHEQLGWFDEHFYIAAELEFRFRIEQDYDFVELSDSIKPERGNRPDEYNFDLSFESGLIRKAYNYARLCSIHIDAGGITGNEAFSSWFEVSILKKMTWEKLHGKKYNPIINISDNRQDAVSPLLSIVIVTCGKDNVLREGLKALSSQTEKNFEVIVVNNGGMRLVDGISDDIGICWIDLDKNYGPSLARNTGAAYSKARYLAFLDDDATADCDFVRNVISHFENDGIVGLRGKILSPCGGYVPQMYDLGDEAIPYAADMEGNCAFSKDAFVQAGGFSEWLFHGEGADLSYRMFKNTGEDIDCMYYFPDVIIYHQPYGNQRYRLERIARAELMKKLLKESNPGIDKYLDFMFNFYQCNRNGIEKKIGRLFNNALFLLDKKPERALEWAKKAVEFDPDAVGSRLLLGSAYLKLGDHDKGQSELEWVVDSIDKLLISGA
jgi:glycosyltransferase involved in cell wall biosynthesis/ADP-heptose:LPS heptosyltransferase